MRGLSRSRGDDHGKAGGAEQQGRQPEIAPILKNLPDAVEKVAGAAGQSEQGGRLRNDDMHGYPGEKASQNRDRQ